MPSATSHRSHPHVFLSQFILYAGTRQTRSPLSFLLGLPDLGRQAEPDAVRARVGCALSEQAVISPAGRAAIPGAPDVAQRSAAGWAWRHFGFRDGSQWVEVTQSGWDIFFLTRPTNRGVF